MIKGSKTLRKVEFYLLVRFYGLVQLKLKLLQALKICLIKLDTFQVPKKLIAYKLPELFLQFLSGTVISMLTF
jgi:hypothetical protein